MLTRDYYTVPIYVVTDQMRQSCHKLKDGVKLVLYNYAKIDIENSEDREDDICFGKRFVRCL